MSVHDNGLCVAATLRSRNCASCLCCLDNVVRHNGLCVAATLRSRNCASCLCCLDNVSPSQRFVCCSYFTKQELRELFVLDDPTTSQTQIQLSKMHHGLRKSDTSLDTHIAFLHTLGMFTAFRCMKSSSLPCCNNHHSEFL